jgi:hypothetical protein
MYILSKRSQKSRGKKANSSYLEFWMIESSVIHPHYNPLDSIRYLPQGKGWLACKADDSTVNCELSVSKNMRASTSCNNMGLHGLLLG